MTASTWLGVILIVPFVASALAPLLAQRVASRWVGVASAAVALAAALALASALPQVAAGESLSATWRWVPALGVEIRLVLDGFSLLFALIVTGMGTLILLYASAYLGPDEDHGRFFAYMLAFMGAMLGVVLSSNLAVLYVFWELTSATSFLLIGYWYHKEGSRYGAQKALLITAGGGLAMLLGFVLLYVEAGTFDLAGLSTQATQIRQSPRYPLITALVLAGAFAKSAQVPFHIWLPNAMEAPTPVSAFLHSATMVKAGLYLVARMVGVLGGTELWTWLVTGVGLASLVWGAALALRQTDLKALMANSTVSQLGLIMSLLGIATPAALAAAVFHTLNHAIFKGSLFLVTGIVEHETGSRDVRRLRGLARSMPLTAGAAGLASLALAGVPPLTGFVSKEMFFEAAWHFGHDRAGLAWLAPALAVLGSSFTMVYALLFFHGVFLARGGSSHDGAGHDPGWSLLGPPLLLGGLALAVGVGPQLVSGALLTPATSALAGAWTSVEAGLWHGLTPALAMSGAALATGLAGYATRHRWAEGLPQMPPALRLDTWYDGFVRQLPAVADRLTRAHVTGRLSDHLGSLVAAVLLLWGYVILRLWGLEWRSASLGAIEPFDVALTGVMAASALATLGVRSRLGMAAALGGVGMPMAVLFVSLRAPDLALTQLIVESIALVLFVLAFRHLPALVHRPVGTCRRAASAALSIGFGLSMATLTLIFTSHRVWPSIAPFFLETSLPLGGGRNVVNVILVDFRGLDTLGEITVLAIAALAVAGLMRRPARRHGAGPDERLAFPPLVTEDLSDAAPSSNAAPSSKVASPGGLERA
ncbi:MAG: DUF4040 domain-containing protein [Firmicutes bacterium]|nr:DUF4040 domain-containing protein [Bacillota bacterium]